MIWRFVKGSHHKNTFITNTVNKIFKIWQNIILPNMYSALLPVYILKVAKMLIVYLLLSSKLLD